MNKIFNLLFFVKKSKVRPNGTTNLHAESR
jgi:hypothetical protein